MELVTAAFGLGVRVRVDPAKDVHLVFVQSAGVVGSGGGPACGLNTHTEGTG